MVIESKNMQTNKMPTSWKNQHLQQKHAMQYIWFQLFHNCFVIAFYNCFVTGITGF